MNRELPLDERRQLAATIVEQFESDIFAYVRRLVGSEADAADLTQDVFARALRKLESLDPDRVRFWLFRVATNIAFNHRRDSARRSAILEKEDPMSDRSPPYPDPTDRVSTEERHGILEEEIALLPRESRALLLLHHHHGLSQREIAAAAELPRSTVADRLRSATGILRQALERRGLGANALAAVPLSDLGSPSLPAGLHGRLVSIAESAIGQSPAFTTSLIVGGILVTKKLLIAALVLFLFSLTAGVGVGRALPQDAEPGDSTVAVDPDSFERAVARATEKACDDLRVRIRELERERDELLGSISELSASVADRAKPGTPEPNEADLDSVDWASLRASIATNRDVLLRLGQIEAQGQDPSVMTAQEQAAYRDILLAWNQAGIAAGKLSEHPFLDPAILPSLMEAVWGEALGLDEAQSEQLVRETQTALETLDIPVDATPAEIYRARLELVDHLSDTVPRLLRGEQTETWASLQSLWNTTAEGNYRKVVVGVGSERRIEMVVDEWRRHYGLDQTHTAALEEQAEHVFAAAQTVLERYGQTGSERRSLDTNEQRRLRLELLDIQIRAEAAMHSSIDPDHLETLRESAPLILSIHGMDHSYIGFENDLAF